MKMYRVRYEFRFWEKSRWFVSASCRDHILAASPTEAREKVFAMHRSCSGPYIVSVRKMPDTADNKHWIAMELSRIAERKELDAEMDRELAQQSAEYWGVDVG